MPYAELDKEVMTADNGNDGIIVVRDLGDIPGGRTLQTKNVAESVIKAGTIIVKNTDGEYEPWDGTSADAKFVGVLKYGVLKSDPRASILTMGQVNGKALPVAPTDAVIAGLPNIQFLNV